MNYESHYNRLINNAKAQSRICYTEAHHIIPRCMGGTDDKENIVNLTPEEHYVAHQLLVKIYPSNHSLINAAAMMIPRRPSNKMYGWLRRKLSAVMSESQTGTKNTQFGTKWIHSIELKMSKRIKKDEKIPDGWSKGRIIDFTKERKDLTFDYKKAACDKKKQQASILAHELFDQFKKSSHRSVCDFAKANNTTQPRLSSLWKKYVDEYNQNRQQGKKFK